MLQPREQCRIPEVTSSIHHSRTSGSYTPKQIHRLLQVTRNFINICQKLGKTHRLENFRTSCLWPFPPPQLLPGYLCHIKRRSCSFLERRMPTAIKSQIFTKHVNIKTTNRYIPQVSNILLHTCVSWAPQAFCTEIAYYYSFSPIIPFGLKYVADLF